MSKHYRKALKILFQNAQEGTGREHEVCYESSRNSHSKADNLKNLSVLTHILSFL